MTPSRVIPWLLAVAALLGLAACTFGDDDGAERDRIQREIGRGADWITALSPPAGFEAIECSRPSSDVDRCWRAPGTPQQALDALAPFVASGGFGDLATDCSGSPTHDGDPTGCTAYPGVLRMVATRDVDTSATSKDDAVLDTSTVWIATVHLGD
ncbi:MAG: hypothetical protein AAGC49_00385 [Brevundimonas sp.]